MAGGLRGGPPIQMTPGARPFVHEVRKKPRIASKELTLYGRIKSQAQCESERLSASYCQRTTAIVASKGGTTGY